MGIERLNFSDIIEDGIINIHKIFHISKREVHTHTFFELVYVLEGSAVQILKNDEKRISAGDFFVIDYDTPHGYIPDKNGFTIINCLFKPEFLDKTFSDVTSFNMLAERYFLKCTGRKISGPISNQIFHDDIGILSVFEKMLKEYEEKKEGYTEMLRFSINTVIIDIVRSKGTQKHISAITEKIILYTEYNYSKPISLTEISKENGYSVAYLSEKFKNDTGISFKNYLQKKRIEEACRLLIDTDLSVLKIGEKVGYCNQKFFNNIFKKLTHQTPREFRNSST